MFVSGLGLSESLRISFGNSDLSQFESFLLSIAVGLGFHHFVKNKEASLFSHWEHLELVELARHGHKLVGLLQRFNDVVGKLEGVEHDRNDLLDLVQSGEAHISEGINVVENFLGLASVLALADWV